MRKLVIVIVVVVILIPAAAIAQPQPQPRPQPRPQPGSDSCSVCDFPPEVIEVDTPEQLRDQMREAEVPVRDYVEDSVATVERGSARALRDFSAWYRYTVDQQNQRELQNRMIGQLFQHALNAGLNFFLPGSGAVAAKLREYSTKAYAFVLSTAPSGTTDPQPYIDRIATDLENGQDRLENMTADMFHNTADQALRDQMQTIRLEYVLEKKIQRAEGQQGAGERTPGPTTRRLLQQLGIAVPGTPTYDTTREEVLDNLLYGVMCARHVGNPVRNCQQEAWHFQALSRSHAMRLIFTNAQPARMYNITDANALNRICPVERQVGYMMMSGDCQRWSRQ